MTSFWEVVVSGEGNHLGLFGFPYLVVKQLGKSLVPHTLCYQVSHLPHLIHSNKLTYKTNVLIIKL